MELVCFGDESGVSIACNCFAVALVCFERRASRPLASHGDDAWLRLASLLGWGSGEMKYRSVARRASRLGVGVGDVLGVIHAEASVVTVYRVHSEGEPLERARVLASMLDELPVERVHLILDHGLVPGRESEARRLLGHWRVATLRFASSRRTRGIQLADITAGGCMELGSCTRDECSSRSAAGKCSGRARAQPGRRR